MTARPTALAVFCGSRKGCNPAFEVAASQTGSLLAKEGIRLVYGGGSIGLMGVVTDAALNHGGDVTGVIPQFLLDYEVGDPDIDELIVVNSMHDRKRTMFERADGFIILPGGLGTLDEAIEIITWKQLQLHQKPIILVNVEGYWDGFETLVRGAISNGFAHEKVHDLFTTVTQVEDILPAIEAAPDPDDVVLTSHL